MMQAPSIIETKHLDVSCLINLSSANRQFPCGESQATDEDVPKNSSPRASLAPGEELNEAEAIRRARKGDAVAFEYLYQLHSRRVYALCLRMVGDTTVAEDLAQDAFLLLFRKIHTFRHESAFTTWLHRLTVNVVLMHLRKKSPPTVSIEAAADPDDESGWPSIDVSAPDPLLTGSIDRVNLTRCIERLSAGYRAIFVLHDIQGYEHHEIGQMLGHSEGNSKSQLHKARTRLRELLQEDERESARSKRLAVRKASSRATVLSA
jgi:RNA polymerase sigma-70 factor (ECF subfamily)